MRYLVTGGAGFIGSHVVDELVRRKQDVIVLDDLSTGKEENLAAVRSKIELCVESVGDLAAVKAACAGVDFVMHLAAQTSVPRSIQKPLETNIANVDGTLNVLVAARDARVKRFVYAASSAAYGETPTLPKTESMPAAPISPYGVSKYVGELYAQCFGRAYGLENVSVRFFNVFGPRQDPSSQYSGVLSRFMLAVLRGEQPVVFGDGNQSRDFTYIDNIVAATLGACEAKNASGMVFNGGTGLQITLKEVLSLLERITGRKISPKYDPPRTGDVLHSQADISLAHRVLGYRPVVDFEEGLRRTWDWYKAAYGRN
ncbi:MAG TPA: SDR family oxidoreductase [Candidatus Acidoferrales bacterium]|nr:SDR family oxidoreductase [Candidatus Acidoferrales bacterium]